MKALLLAAGRATRLGALSATTPKCLHKVGQVALIDRLVHQLQQVGVGEILINTHHLPDQVLAHIAGASWRDVATIVHEEALLGTLGTLRTNRKFFGEEPAWVLHADNFIEGDLTNLRQAFDFRPEGIWGAALTFESDDPKSCGVLVADSQGVVVEFHEKVADPPSNRASAATFLFDQRILAFVAELPPEARDISQDLMPLLVGRMLAVPADGAVVDIGTPKGLADARRLATRNTTGESDRRKEAY